MSICPPATLIKWSLSERVYGILIELVAIFTGGRPRISMAIAKVVVPASRMIVSSTSIMEAATCAMHFLSSICEIERI